MIRILLAAMDNIFLLVIIISRSAEKGVLLKIVDYVVLLFLLLVLSTVDLILKLSVFC